MSEVELDQKGRILLPVEIRRAAGSRRFTVRVKEGKIELHPVPDPKTVKGKYRRLLRVSLEQLEEAQERFVEKGRR
jgi:bifunctional DNA-binding transcriptional regulator/antitoxin component of YhaV-PrlF toxin-antitoxin module